MAFDRAARFPNIEVMAAAFLQIDSAGRPRPEPIPLNPVPLPGKLRYWIWLLAALLLVAGGSIAAWVALTPSKPVTVSDVASTSVTSPPPSPPPVRTDSVVPNLPISTPEAVLAAPAGNDSTVALGVEPSIARALPAPMAAPPPTPPSAPPPVPSQPPAHQPTLAAHEAIPAHQPFLTGAWRFTTLVLGSHGGSSIGVNGFYELVAGFDGSSMRLLKTGFNTGSRRVAVEKSGDSSMQRVGMLGGQPVYSVEVELASSLGMWFVWYAVGESDLRGFWRQTGSEWDKAGFWGVLRGSLPREAERELSRHELMVCLQNCAINHGIAGADLAQVARACCGACNP